MSSATAQQNRQSRADQRQTYRITVTRRLQFAQRHKKAGSARPSCSISLTPDAASKAKAVSLWERDWLWSSRFRRRCWLQMHRSSGSTDPDAD